VRTWRLWKNVRRRSDCSEDAVQRGARAEDGVGLGVVGLMRYLKSKYLPDLEVSDEGGCWETEDVSKLEARRIFFGLKARRTDQRPLEHRKPRKNDGGARHRD